MRVSKPSWVFLGILLALLLAIGGLGGLLFQMPVALALVGLIASRLLPLEKFPDIEFPGIFVQIPYEGSSPEEVERLIAGEGVRP